MEMSVGCFLLLLRVLDDDFCLLVPLLFESLVSQLSLSLFVPHCLDVRIDAGDIDVLIIRAAAAVAYFVRAVAVVDVADDNGRMNDDGSPHAETTTQRDVNNIATMSRRRHIIILMTLIIDFIE